MKERATVFAFGDFELDEDRSELRRGGAAVELQLRPFRLLTYLMRNRDRTVPKEELFERIWPDAVVSDAALASALRDVRRVLGDDGTTQAWIQTQRGRGFRFVAPVEELPASVTGSATQPSRATTAPARALAVVAVLLLVALGLWLLSRPDAETTPLAVLPFLDLSPAGDQEYFADGMTEELIGALSQVEGLRVVARTSAFAFKGRNEDIRTIGDLLGVRMVIEGSVRREGDRLRITAQLIRVEDGLHIWSDTYDRKLEGVFAIQEEIAGAVSDALRVRLAPAPSEAPARDLRAYELHLIGRHLESKASEETTRDAIRYFERALAIDPGYAEAYAALGLAYFSLWDFRYDPRPEIFERAMAATRRALEIDPDLPEGHATLGLLLSTEYQWTTSEREIDRSLELNPSLADAWLDRATLLAEFGRIEEAVEAAERGRQLDPLSPLANRFTGRLYYYARNHQRAIELMTRAHDLGADAISSHYLVLSYLASGREEEALEASLSFAPEAHRPAIQKGNVRGGVRGAVRGGIAAAVEASGRTCGPAPETTALWLAYLGETEQMFACMEEALAIRRLWYIAVEPLFEPYRSDPRFVSILERMGLRG